ncbi:putative ribosomal protein S1 [Leptospira kirschneri str. 2008720114]|uniref:30S ribosomal protein S1 n=1 Tax=Leptospira kirschneri TaxID=29507 RepID=UPI000298173D|nr:30S ribosomal protein S1 [Leptospira kirschneri]EKP04746.1 putative ribosomal protein S1 [Leptospira kirschneri str. 2008720114]
MTNKEEKSTFAEVFKQWEQSIYEEPELRKDQVVERKIVSVDNDYVYVAIEGLKQEGRIPRGDFDEAPERGNYVSAIVKRKESQDSGCILSKKEADQRKGWEIVKEAFKNGYQVTGRLINEIKGKGYIVNVEGVELFLPASQLSYKFKEGETFKNKELEFKIIELNDRTRSGVVSRKKLLDEVNEEKWDALLLKLKVGDKVKAIVSKIASFGVFCEVDGVTGLLRQRDISYKKYAPFKQYFQIGQEVELVILELDKENNKLALGLKQLYEDPWVWAERSLEKEMVIRGTVTSLTKFGAFVELKEGLEGLIHTSELAWSKKPPQPKDILKKGQEIEALVLDIDFKNRRLSLGLKQLQPNPWDQLGPEIRRGNVLEGVITGITKYGAFVEVENGIEGLIHISDITWDEKVSNPTSQLKKGDTVRYMILDVNLDAQRISCGLKQLMENPYEVFRNEHPVGTIVEGKVKSIKEFGIFVEVAPGIEGLVHISEVPNGKEVNLAELYKSDEIVKTAVIKVDVKNKKISLSIKDFDKALEREEMSKYLKTSDTPSRESLGSFLNTSLR